MNAIVFALRRPVTVMMLVVALVSGGVYSIVRMQKDIFPSLNQPVLYVIHRLKVSLGRREGIAIRDRITLPDRKP